jgi:small subunit ribosomal protein S17
MALRAGILRRGCGMLHSIVTETSATTPFVFATPRSVCQFNLRSPVGFQPIRSFSSSPTPLGEPSIDIASMSNEELADTSTIPGWEFVHTPPREYPRGALVGTVVSVKMSKTVNVAVERYHIVPKYRKRKIYTRKFMAHDENEVANVGDMVMIVPCHRISRHKHFMLREIVKEKGQL